MKSFAFAITLSAANALSTVEFEYMNYLARFNKQSADFADFNARREAFEEADAFIKAHNAQSSNNYTVGHNQFSDWYPHEIKAMNGYRRPSGYQGKEPKIFNTDKNADSVDWVTAGAVTPVKN